MRKIDRPWPNASSAMLSRRGLLQAGALAMGGLTLGDVLRLRAESPATGKPQQKSVIMIHLSGGPSHLDMYDMKPDAPREYRGEFDPIRTNVPGMEICELMPMQAKIADKFTILRGVQLAHLHTANEFYSGYPWQESPRASVPDEARRPALGSVVSRLRGGSAIPPYVSLDNQVDWERAYYLGQEHEPFRLGGNSPRESLANMSRLKQVAVDRSESRASLLQTLDTLPRSVDATQGMSAVDAFQVRALDIVTSGKVREAFEVEPRARAGRARYGDRPFRDPAGMHEKLPPARALSARCCKPAAYRGRRFGRHTAWVLGYASLQL
jgi:hypothetical protein